MMKITNRTIVSNLVALMISTSLFLPGVSYANDWRYNEPNPVEERQNMKKIVVGGLAILGLLLLANSGSGSDAEDNKNAEYYFEPEQPRYTTSSSSHTPTTTGFYGNCHGGSFYSCEQ